MSHKDEMKKEMQEAWDKFSHAINNFSYEDQAEAFCEVLSNEHRTLQQNFWRMMIQVIKKYAKMKEGWYDLRNEASVKMCRELGKYLEDHLYTNLPTI